MLPLLCGWQLLALTLVCRALVLSGPCDCAAPMQLVCYLCPRLAVALAHTRAPRSRSCLSLGLAAVLRQCSRRAALLCSCPPLTLTPVRRALILSGPCGGPAPVELASRLCAAVGRRARPLPCAALSPRASRLFCTDAVGRLPLPRGCLPLPHTSVRSALVLSEPYGCFTPVQLACCLCSMARSRAR